MKTISAIALSLLCLCAFSACGSLRLHNEARNKQAEAAKEAWAKVDLGAVIAAERANLASLLEQELQTQEALAAGIRDQHLLSLVTAPTLKAGLVDPVNARLAGFGTLEQFARAGRSVGDMRRNLREIGDARETLGDVLRQDPPDCAALASGAPPALSAAIGALNDTRKLLANETLQRLQQLCAKALKTRDALEPLSGTIMRRALRAYDDVAAELAQTRQATSDRRNRYEIARKTYDDELKKLKGGDANARQKVDAAVEDLKTAFDSLKLASDAFSVQLVSEERLKSIDAFLLAVAEAKPGEVPEGASDAVAAFILVPDLLDNARKALADARKPLAMPLLMQRNYEQLRLEAANRDIAAREAALRLSEELLEVLYAQGYQLFHAQEALGDRTITPLHGRSALSAFGARCDGEEVERCRDAKESLYRSAALYLDALNRLDARRFKLEYQRIAVIHERALAYAEVNAKQWQSLIGVTIDQVNASAAGGIKSEQIIALLNAAGVVWIGAGVN